MSRTEILEGVRQVFADQLKIADLTEDTHLLRDLKLDSIQQLTLVVELENRFQIAFEDEDQAGIESVGDVVDLLARRLSSPPPPVGLRRGSPKPGEDGS
ncbi:MAG TPA: acyl carrier protein [Vicinamibacteria bacterium]|jgi:acyl carrier protein